MTSSIDIKTFNSIRTTSLALGFIAFILLFWVMMIFMNASNNNQKENTN